jgi:hypothetical protein
MPHSTGVLGIRYWILGIGCWILVDPAAPVVQADQGHVGAGGQLIYDVGVCAVDGQSVKDPKGGHVCHLLGQPTGGQVAANVSLGLLGLLLHSLDYTAPGREEGGRGLRTHLDDDVQALVGRGQRQRLGQRRFQGGDRVGLFSVVEWWRVRQGCRSSLKGSAVDQRRSQRQHDAGQTYQD